jgi:hypothetical protein
MLRIIRLKRSSIGLSEAKLREGLKVLAETGAIASYAIRRDEVSMTIDHVRAEMVLEHLTGIEPHNPENLPKSKKNTNENP